MTTENGLVVTQVSGGETRSYLTNPNEWMGNVHAETDPVTGGIRKATANGRDMVSDLVDNSDKSYLLLGGDHPYAQWKNGLAKLYAAHDLRTYLAINTNTVGVNNMDPGQTDMLTWADLAAYAKGDNIEVIAHGARHVQDWTRINTGVKIQYAGANATATVQVSATQLIATAGGGDSLTLTLASESLATVKSQLEAISGWTVTLAPELSGAESAASLLQIAATSVKSINQRFAAGGGISIYYSGTSYRYILGQILSNTLKVFADGVRVFSVSLSGGATLSSIVAAINASGISGLVAKLCDNQKTEAPSFESYVSGSELAVSLAVKSPGLVISQTPAIFDAGLAQWYMVERQLEKCVEVAAANGVDLRSFANSGSNFIAQHRDGHRFFSIRGNLWSSSDSTAAQGYPAAIPAYLAEHFRPVFGFTYASMPTAARSNAVWEALADSPGFLVDALMHKVLSDGSSGYDFSSTDSAYYDQIEAEWTDTVATLAAKVEDGTIANILPRQVAGIASRVAKPKNLIFNPKYKNSGESLRVSSLNEILMPGWQLLTNPANFSAVSVANDSITLDMLSASEMIPLKQYLYLEPGKTYKVGCYVENLAYISGNGVSMQVNHIRGRQRAGWPQQQTNTNRSRYSVSRSDFLTHTFTMPSIAEFNHGRIVSAAFGAGIDMSVNKNIRLNAFAKGAFDIDCSAGAGSAAAVKAWEAAAAINAAIKANAAYPPEFHTLARAENDRVILELPVRSPDASFVMTVVDGLSASITATAFGSSDNFATSFGADSDSIAAPVLFQIALALASGASVRISNPFCSEVLAR